MYLAHDTVLDRDVAFCVLKAESYDPKYRQRVIEEAWAVAKLGGHPNIVPIYEYGQEGEEPYMVLPLMAGGSVEELIGNAADRLLELERGIQIAIDVCHGLDFAHRNGILHRDIKPGNIWLTEDGVAQIGDFGLALTGDFTRFTGDGRVVGTLAYSPPEMIKGETVDQRADLYQLGVMIYEMVAGVRPFVGEQVATVMGQHLYHDPAPPSDHNPQCPPVLESLILQLLSKDPSDRPGFADNVLAVLEDLEINSSYQFPSTKGREPGEPGASHETDGERPGPLQSLDQLNQEQQRIRELENQNERLRKRLDRALGRSR